MMQKKPEKSLKNDLDDKGEKMMKKKPWKSLKNDLNGIRKIMMQKKTLEIAEKLLKRYRKKKGCRN